jgi:hypothetical protein
MPEAFTFREVREHIGTPGFRTRQITLVTTLLDAESSRGADRAALYRWRGQGDSYRGPLKTTMPRDVRHGQTMTGVRNERPVFVLSYHLVRLVIWPSAPLPQVDAARMRVLDARRWLETSGRGVPRAALLVTPARPARVDPRVQKRRPKAVPFMITPRHELRPQRVQPTMGA